MRILFSPVGMTDPLTWDNDDNKGYYEGALLHICRYYMPDIVYVYFSEETLDLEEKDNRYSKSLELIQQAVQKKMQIKRIERPSLVDVQLFDIFLLDFQEILTKIRKDYPEAEILLNVSSGTPAMKSALQILAASKAISLKPLQVSTPAKRANNKRSDSRKIDEEWKQNLDNLPGAKKRVTVSKNHNLLYEFNKKILITLINTYDYRAAKMAANQMSGFLSTEFITLLEAAVLRSELKYEQASEIISKLGFNGLMDAPDQAAEYFLLLDIKIKKHQYTDYLRAMTPFILELFYQAVEMQYHLKLEDYTKKNNRFYWDKRKLKGSVLDGKFLQKEEYHLEVKPWPYKYTFPEGNMLSWHLTNLIENLSSDTNFIKKTIRIRRIEEKLRNLAAHTMQSFTQDEIKNTIGYTPEEIHEQIFSYLTDYTAMPVESETRQQYDKINGQLKMLL